MIAGTDFDAMDRPEEEVSVWEVPGGQKIKVRLRHFLVMLYLIVPMGLTATLGTISFADSSGDAIASLWPSSAFQVVFSIWFGLFGAIAGTIGPMLGNGIIGGSPFVYLIGNAIQSCLAGLWFRHRRLDPQLRSRRDWVGLILVGCIVGNGLGAIAGVSENAIRHAIAGDTHSWTHYGAQFLRWFLGNTIPSLILAPAMLKTGSAIVTRGPFFCQRFWGGAYSGAMGRMRWFRFDDLPISAKLMLLVLIAGMLPLYCVAGWVVLDTLVTAEILSVQANQEAACDIRDEIERHELLLRGYTLEYDRVAGRKDEQEKLLQKWRAESDSFENLQLVDRAVFEKQTSGESVGWLNEGRIVFSTTDIPVRHKGVSMPFTRIRGTAPLSSEPNKVLTGLVVWRERPSISRELTALPTFRATDREGQTLHSQVPESLERWRVPREGFEGMPRVVRVDGHSWNVAEASIDRLGIRFFAFTSSRRGRETVLANIPHPVAELINLAIFGSLIAGSAIAKRLAGRVLEIARTVRQAGTLPRQLDIPERGRDELGYLAHTLNRISGEMEDYVNTLRVTTAEKERLEREVELARQVQQSVLPKHPPKVRGYELASFCVPAYEVGGDFYDTFISEAGHLVLMIGDAAGKGLGAAMFMTENRAVARMSAMGGLTPDAVLAAANRAVLSDRRLPGDFMTLFCAVLDVRQHVFHYASAGHNPPVLVSGGQTSLLNIGGFPLAILEHEGYSTVALGLSPGDCVVMYTDGITEAMNPSLQYFGASRLRACLEGCASREPQEVVKAVVEAVRGFVDGAAQSDDMTLLVVRRVS